MQQSARQEALSVGQLYRRSKNALAREFRGPVWVTGEIKAMREMRGSLYLSLVEPGDFSDGTDISIDIACWPRQRALVQAQLAAAGISLAAGMVVRVQGNVTLSKFAKLQVELQALDTEALLGRQEAEKRKLYKTLKDEGLFERNRLLPTATVPLRIGLVSSEGSEGYNDFLGQLTRSPFAFAVTFFHSPVQGPTAPALLAKAISALAAEPLDVIAVVRGGGGELDAFDKEPVARAITASPIPIWTGIGHTGDRAVADDVANRFFITPTECGQALVSEVATFMNRVDANVQRLHRQTERTLDMEAERVKATGRRLAADVRAHVARSEVAVHRQAERARRCADRDLALASAALDGYRKDVARSATIVPQEACDAVQRLARDLVTSAARHTQHIEQDARLWRAQVSALDPVRQLQRGYTLTKDTAGRLIRSTADLKEGEEIMTSFADGEASSTVFRVTPAEETP